MTFMRNGYPRSAVCMALGVAALCGCKPIEQSARFDPIAMRQAVDIVNRNTARVSGCLKAEGVARGHIRDDSGVRRHFDFHTVLLVIPQRHLYLTMQSGLGTQEALLGSNDESYWVHVRQDGDTYRFGTHAVLAEHPDASTALRPDLVIEALGLGMLPDTVDEFDGPVQRIVDDYQQVIMIGRSAGERPYVAREYWLDRYEPQLIRRIVLRDVEGRTLMDAHLDNYKPMNAGALAGRSIETAGPLLPRRIAIEWPTEDAVLRFSISKWEPKPDRNEDHDAFRPPHERGERFDFMVDLDREIERR